MTASIVVTALAVLAIVGSYVRHGVLAVRGSYKALSESGDEGRKVIRRRMKLHFAAIVGGPLVVMAAAPWGVYNIAAAFGLLVVCQIAFLHTMLVIGFTRQRRARRQGSGPREGDARPAGPGGPPW